MFFQKHFDEHKEGRVQVQKIKIVQIAQIQQIQNLAILRKFKNIVIFVTYKKKYLKIHKNLFKNLCK